jgi:hypothetical protein
MNTNPLCLPESNSRPGLAWHSDLNAGAGGPYFALRLSVHAIHDGRPHGVVCIFRCAVKACETCVPVAIVEVH